jgi:hypothetical protein
MGVHIAPGNTHHRKETPTNVNYQVYMHQWYSQIYNMTNSFDYDRGPWQWTVTTNQPFESSMKIMHVFEPMQCKYSLLIAIQNIIWASPIQWYTHHVWLE